MLNALQLSQILESLPGPARVYDAAGAVMAQNERARGYVETGHEAAWENSARRELGGGIWLQTWNAERRAREKDERAASNANENAIADISILANSMAHSIRNPLSAIVTASGLVQSDESVSEETAMLLGIIKKESLQLNRLLSDFVDYVRPRAFNPTTFDLAEGARQAVRDAQKDGVLKPEIEVQDELPRNFQAFGDEMQIAQALRSLVRNAGEAMNEGGSLRLSGESDGECVTLYIEDSGRGLSPEDRQRAFEPFYSNTPQGAGLGLPLARAAVERCGGDIRIESRGEEGGARVCLELPVAPQA